jgi:hypothetical protein
VPALAGSSLLGFDVRRRHEDCVRNDWDTERRNCYLLRPEVPSPSSVDPVVWPSVFDYVLPGSASGVSKESLLRVELVESQTREMALRLWPSRTEMSLTFASGRGALTGIPIAVQLLRHSPASPDEFWDAVLDPALPESALPVDWLRLGYDIADRDFISALSNCGYRPPEREQLRQRWASHLNDYGLFEEIDEATLFKQLSDRRVMEHSPFNVYSLYRAPAVWKQEANGSASNTRRC